MELWIHDGGFHRIDGPAFINHIDGSEEWWINDRDITNEVQEWMKENAISYPFDCDAQLLFKLRWL